MGSCESDCGGALSDARSRIEWCSKVFESRSVSRWCSCKQQTVELSLTEAEYNSFSLPYPGVYSIDFLFIYIFAYILFQAIKLKSIEPSTGRPINTIFNPNFKTLQCEPKKMDYALVIEPSS